jgi:hypothetical protein
MAVEPENVVSIVAPTEGRKSVRHALLICNSKYVGGSELAGVVQDSKTFGKVLSDPETCQFSASTIFNRGLLEVRREIARICQESVEGDTLLIYYSGNGVKLEDGSLYLVVADTEPEYIHATALDAEFILSQLRRSSCRKLILLIDTCHSGCFFENNRGIPNGLFAITSCGADETSSDTPEGGAFTVAICAALKGAAADSDGDGRVSLDELYEFVKARLRTLDVKGTPQKWVWNVPEPVYMTNVPRHIFISYAREDLEEARKVAQALQDEGFCVWFDVEGILSGSWKERVVQSLKKTRAIVMLFTANSLRSEAVRKELDYANRTKVPIIPVELGEVDFTQGGDWFAFDYSELHRPRIDKDHREEGLRKLAEAIRSLRKDIAMKTPDAVPVVAAPGPATNA